MTCLSTESDLKFINKNSTLHNVEALVYGRVELMNMRHCPFSPIKKCGLKGCPTCKFNNGFLKSNNGDMMKVIRYGDYSKIYPYEASISDNKNISKDVSRLYSVMSAEDLINIDKAKDRKSYAKGVI